jgi:putative ABC transport system permease protein
MRTWAFRQLRESMGQYTASIAVVAVVSAFTVLLLEVIAVLTDAATKAGANDGTIALALFTLAVVFLGMAVTVASVVISNTFSMVYAGRTREIALLRLIGATTRQIRRTSLIDGLIVGLLGTLTGIAIGIGLSAIAIAIVNADAHVSLTLLFPPQVLLVPFSAVVVTVLSSHAGSRAVARVSPAEASRSMPEGRQLSKRSSRTRTVTGDVLFGIGAVFMGLGVVEGQAGPSGLLIAFVGGLFSVIGLIIAAPALISPVLTLVTRMLPRGTPAQLAGANMRLDPLRSSRTTLSIVIGVMLLTMFAVAGEMMGYALHHYTGAGNIAEAETIISSMVGTAYGLTSFSALIAGIGLASTLAMSVIQRRREFAVLRSLGFTVKQVRRMVLTESLIVAVTGLIVGIVLGIVYGFVGAQSILASLGDLPPVVSPVFLAVLVVGAILFGIVVSLAPGRRAGLVSPAEALRDA